MAKFKVIRDPEQRKQHNQAILIGLKLGHVVEDPDACYCGISLTSTPEELKEIIGARQKSLMQLLISKGIDAYDPGSSEEYSPDLNPDATPQEVFSYDSARVAAAAYFSGHKLLPSEGTGVESALALGLNKISVQLIDKNIGVSKMMTPSTIYLAYDNFEEQKDDIGMVFDLLHDYDPALGEQDGQPVLLGWRKNGNHVLNLEEEVYNQFPQFRFFSDGKKDIVKLKAMNPEIFYENRS